MRLEPLWNRQRAARIRSAPCVASFDRGEMPRHSKGRVNDGDRDIEASGANWGAASSRSEVSSIWAGEREERDRAQRRRAAILRTVH